MKTPHSPRSILRTALAALVLAAAGAQADELTPEQFRQAGRADRLEMDGSDYYKKRQFAESLRCIAQAHAIWEGLYLPEKYPHGHFQLARSLSNLALAHLYAGDRRRALPLARRAAAMAERLYPDGREPRLLPLLVDTLSAPGNLQQGAGELPEARASFEKALAYGRKLYPPDRFPQGHPVLAQCLTSLGVAWRELGDYPRALDCFQQCVAMQERLYPPQGFPRGHPKLAKGLQNLTAVVHDAGDLTLALSTARRCLAMREQLFPTGEYPHGHNDLAVTLTTLGALYKAQGEYRRALPYMRRAVDMFEALGPPGGPPSLNRAAGLINLATILLNLDDFPQALRYMEQALAELERLYPREQYPRGHPQLARCLSSLAGLDNLVNGPARALERARRALAMWEGLLPRDQFPLGHPGLAHSHSGLALLHWARGDTDQALAHQGKALRMAEALYPPDRNPRGHPDLAWFLSLRAEMLHGRGDAEPALPLARRAAVMQQDLLEAFAAGVSEAEALNYAAHFPAARDRYLTLSRQLGRPDEEVYASLWRGKAAVLRVLQSRRRAASGSADPEVRRLEQELVEARRQLARRLLRPATEPGAGGEDVRQLAERKERLEQQLAQRLPDLRRPSAARDPAELARGLPERSAFVDLIRYDRLAYEPDKAGRDSEVRVPSYVAFVLSPGRPVRRVELGPAGILEAALTRWREDIAAGKEGAAAARLGRLVWEPLSRHVPADTATVFLAPDGALHRLPWAALPGRRPGTVLLEDHALAVVPHGPFLLKRLAGEGPAAGADGTVLAVGGVRYDRAPDGPEAAAGPGGPAGESAEWGYLAGTERELESVRALAGGRKVVVRRGSQAGLSRLLADLPEARWAHLATHGFFDGPEKRSVLQLRPEDYRAGLRGERIGVGLRSPLVLSGLVLAGANRKGDGPGRWAADGGILTGEDVAGLPLLRLELAVLSACETGLGEVAGGEGVFGLQRAFHIAGARNVVASLWKVDDEATAALMALFYHKLWREKKAPLEALREAQLALYRHPDHIGALARERGLNFDKVVRLPAAAPADAPPGGRAPVKQWAAFTLSGPGR
jgi:CHAT domain-containing protein/tetratricopeptide (TPR) repeat protein